MNDYKKILAYFIGGLIFVFVAVFGSNALDQLAKSKAHISASPTPVVQQYQQPVVCPPNYPAYKAFGGQTVHLLPKPINNYASKGQLRVQAIITEDETQESKVVCGYLYIKAGTTDNGPLKSWESIYINPDNHGGHLNKTNSFGPGDSNDYSEYIYNLNKVEYWEDNRNIGNVGQLRKADWGAVLNTSNRITFNIAFNTLDPNAWLYDISISYKCINPNTGQENQDCKLNVTSFGNASFSL